MIVKSIPLMRILRFREVNLYKTTKVANTQNYKEKKSQTLQQKVEASEKQKNHKTHCQKLNLYYYSRLGRKRLEKSLGRIWLHIHAIRFWCE